MKYRIATRKNGFIIQQSEDDKNTWRTADRTGFYQHRTSAGSRMRQLRNESVGRPDDLAAKIMRSRRFCVVDS
jgi:hypothetical protein